MNIGISKIILGGAIALGAVVILSGAFLFFGRTKSEILDPQPLDGSMLEGKEFPESDSRESAPYQYARPIPKDNAVTTEEGESISPNSQNTVTVKEQHISSESSEKLIFPQDYEPEAGGGEESYDPSQDSEAEGE